MNTRLKSLLYISGFVLIYAVYYWVVPLVINISTKAADIEKYALNKLGIKINLVEPELKMGLTPSVWISAKEFRILNPDGSPPLDVKSPKLKIQLLPLIIGKVHLAYFSSEDIKANFRFDKSSRFYIGKYLIMDNANPILSFDNSKILIDNYKFTLKDELQNNNIILVGDYLNIPCFNLKKHLIFSTNSKLKVNDRYSIINADIDIKLPFKRNFDSDRINFSGSITDFHLSDFSPYLKKISKGEIQSASGVINIEAKTKYLKNDSSEVDSKLTIENFSLIFKDKFASIHHHGKLKLALIADISNNKLRLRKFNLYAKDMSASLSGDATSMRSKNPNMNFFLVINKSRIENFINLIPATKEASKEINLIALKKHGYYSDIMGNLSIAGKPDRPKISGKIMSYNGYVTKPLHPSIPKAIVKLSFENDKMDLYVNVHTNIDQNVIVEGPIELYDEKKTILRVLSTKRVDLQTTQEILVPIHEVFKFDLGPVPIMKLYGNGNVDLKIWGNKENPHITGAFNFSDTTATFNDINNMQLKNGQGTLKFLDTNTHFYTKSASLNSKPVSVDGWCDLKGVLNFKVVANGQNLDNLLKIVETSPMLTEIKPLTNRLTGANGKIDFSLNLLGQVKDINQVKLGDSIVAKGKIKLLGNSVDIYGLKTPLMNLFGDIDYDNTNISLNLYSILNSSKMTIKGFIKNNIANISMNSNQLYLNDLKDYFCCVDGLSKKLIDDLPNIRFNLDAFYKGSTENFDLKDFALKGSILQNFSNNKDLMVKSGTFELINSNLKLKNIRGTFKNNSFASNVSVSNMLSNNQKVDAAIYANDFDLSSLNSLLKLNNIPQNLRNIIEKIQNIQGSADLNILVKNNSVKSRVKLQNISFVYSPLSLPVKFYSGTVEFDKDYLVLYKVNSMLDTMPILIDGTVKNVLKDPYFSIYVNSKPTQRFIEKYVNTKAVYPLKIRGDIIYSSRITGTKNNLNIKTELNLEKDSNIYYMGSTLGDITTPIRVYIDANITPAYINLNNFQYDKLISSQNNKEFISPQINAKGRIYYSRPIAYLHNIYVKTLNPTDAKIFNIIFKKPMVKQGIFNSNVSINGPVNSPKLIGTLNFKGIDIPLLDTTVRDISFDFKDKTINIDAFGEIFSNDIKLNAVAENNLEPPYKFNDIDIYCKNIDINKTMQTLNTLQFEADKNKISAPKQEFDIKTLVINNAKVRADSVLVKNVSAQNLIANLKISEKLLLSVDDFKFDIAGGKVDGSLTYNLLSANTSLNMSVQEVNANLISDALFDLPNQIYGALNGEIRLICNGRNHKSCMNTLSGRGGFEVKNGRMPKLGSLEYLLKASNLVKSGITGLSINSLIDLVSPLKTGEFQTIRGSFDINSGIAKPIQIFSKGKDLSLFISGSYNFSNLIADLNVFGRLSKKITTILGPIGNASINTLFNTIPGLNLDEEKNSEFIQDINKIPGLDLSDKLYRIFTVKIFGDINGENYVQSFKWVE